MQELKLKATYKKKRREYTSMVHDKRLQFLSFEVQGDEPNLLYVILWWLEFNYICTPYTNQNSYRLKCCPCTMEDGVTDGVSIFYRPLDLTKHNQFLIAIHNDHTSGCLPIVMLKGVDGLWYIVWENAKLTLYAFQTVLFHFLFLFK